MLLQSNGVLRESRHLLLGQRWLRLHPFGHFLLNRSPVGGHPALHRLHRNLRLHGLTILARYAKYIRRDRAVDEVFAQAINGVYQDIIILGIYRTARIHHPRRPGVDHGHATDAHRQFGFGQRMTEEIVDRLRRKLAGEHLAVAVDEFIRAHIQIRCILPGKTDEGILTDGAGSQRKTIRRRTFCQFPATLFDRIGQIVRYRAGHHHLTDFAADPRQVVETADIQ